MCIVSYDNGSRQTTYDKLGTVIRLVSRTTFGDISLDSKSSRLWIRKHTYLLSSSPHQIPIPATEPSCPLPLHAPSQNTTSHSSTFSASDDNARFLFGVGGDVSTAVVESAAGDTGVAEPVEDRPFAKDSASA